MDTFDFIGIPADIGELSLTAAVKGNSFKYLSSLLVPEQQIEMSKRDGHTF